MSYEFIGETRTIFPGSEAWCQAYPTAPGCTTVQASASKPGSVSGKDILTAGVDMFKSLFGGGKNVQPSNAPPTGSPPWTPPRQSAGLFGISTDTLLIVGVGIAAFLYLRKRK